MNHLTIDIGNSKVKLDVWADNSRHLMQIVAPSLDAEKVASLCREYEISNITYCCVGKKVTSLADQLKDYAAGEIMEFTNHNAEKYPIIDSYRQSLGVDRVAAFIGATTLYPNEALLIVDAGTALTVDVVDGSGIFRGGNISLGIRGRLRALHEYTATLPLVDKQGPVGDFGTNTDSAIRNGAVNGVVAEIIYSFNKAQKNFGVSKIVITGGDAQLLLQPINAAGIPTCFDPFLVGRGLDADYRGSFQTKNLKDSQKILL